MTEEVRDLIEVKKIADVRVGDVLRVQIDIPNAKKTNGQEVPLRAGAVYLKVTGRNEASIISRKPADRLRFYLTDLKPWFEDGSFMIVDAKLERARNVEARQRVK